MALLWYDTRPTNKGIAHHYCLLFLLLLIVVVKVGLGEAIGVACLREAVACSAQYALFLIMMSKLAYSNGRTGTDSSSSRHYRYYSK